MNNKLKLGIALSFAGFILSLVSIPLINKGMSEEIGKGF